MFIAGAALLFRYVLTGLLVGRTALLPGDIWGDTVYYQSPPWSARPYFTCTLVSVGRETFLLIFTVLFGNIFTGLQYKWCEYSGVKLINSALLPDHNCRKVCTFFHT